MKFTAMLIAAGLALVAPAAAQETRSFIDDAGRVIEMPVNPERIVALQDIFFTVPLIELGIHPIGSHGRAGDDGQPFLRSSKMLTGVDFDNTDIVFMGTGTEIDPETVAAVQPDLIILSTNQDPQLFAEIAPTILLDFRRLDNFELYDRLAELTGTTASLELLKVRYGEQIAQLTRLGDPSGTSINVIAAVNGQVRSYARFAALGKVLQDAGFAQPDAVADVEYGQYSEFSPEMLPEMDADIIFVTYRAEFGETPADAFAQLEETVPNFCNFLVACQQGRMIAIPRDETFATSYGALGTLAYAVLAASTAANAISYSTN